MVVRELSRPGDLGLLKISRNVGGSCAVKSSERKQLKPVLSPPIRAAAKLFCSWN